MFLKYQPSHRIILIRTSLSSQSIGILYPGTVIGTPGQSNLKQFILNFTRSRSCSNEGYQAIKTAYCGQILQQILQKIPFSQKKKVKFIILAPLCLFLVLHLYLDLSLSFDFLGLLLLSAFLSQSLTRTSSLYLSFCLL